MRLDIKNHYKLIRQILILILFLNWLVAAAKIIYGLLSHCVSMTADGFHSLSDGASNIIGLVGISVASQPKDKEHPYGHRKYETLFALIIAALLFIVTFNLFKQGLQRLSHQIMPRIDLRSFIIMFITLGINFWVMNYEYKKGKHLQSEILISDSMHTRADIFVSLSVIITLLAMKLGLPVFLDAITTMVISLFIGYTGYEIIRHNAAILCDTAPIVDVKKIVDIVLDIPDVKTCHKIRTRGRPDDIYIDLHVQVKPNMHINRAHEISYAIEEAIKKSLPEVTDVVVHMEPREEK
ncbi:cation transporter [bacterium]|nr:MAG: cation transporter [bacterium]